MNWTKKLLRAKLIEKQNNLCFYCEEVLRFDSVRKWGQPGSLYPTLEHIVPRSAGGLDEEENIVVVHRRCNARANIEFQKKEKDSKSEKK